MDALLVAIKFVQVLAVNIAYRVWNILYVLLSEVDHGCYIGSGILIIVCIIFIEIPEIMYTLTCIIILTNLLIYIKITSPKRRLKSEITRLLAEDAEKKKIASDLVARLNKAEEELARLEEDVRDEKTQLTYWRRLFGDPADINERKRALAEKIHALEEKKIRIDDERLLIARDYAWFGTVSQQEHDNINSSIIPICQDALQQASDNENRAQLETWMRRLRVETNKDAAEIILKDFPEEFKAFQEVYPPSLEDLRKKYLTVLPSNIDNATDIDTDVLIQYFFVLGLFVGVIYGIVMGIKTYKKRHREPL